MKSMITLVRGEITYVGKNFAEVASGSIGYKIFCLGKALGAYSVGQEVEIFTHLHVRDDALELYGFQTREERDFFEILIGISGIGPKSATGILAAAPLGLLKKAIASGDTSVLTKVSGIGQKTAQRVVLELQGKFEHEAMPGELREGGDVIDALVGLGYTYFQAQQALREVPESIGGVENKVKEALKLLGK